MNTAFQTKIMSVLHKAVTELYKSRPDAKHNTGTQLAEAFMWDTITDYAKKKAEAAWKKLENEDIIPDQESRRTFDPGERTLAESPRFVLQAKISQRVNKFSPDALAKALKEKYRVPEPTAKKMIDEAKVPGFSQIRMEIVERT